MLLNSTVKIRTHLTAFIWEILGSHQAVLHTTLVAPNSGIASYTTHLATPSRQSVRSQWKEFCGSSRLLQTLVGGRWVKNNNNNRSDIPKVRVALRSPLDPQANQKRCQPTIYVTTVWRFRIAAAILAWRIEFLSRPIKRPHVSAMNEAKGAMKECSVSDRYLPLVLLKQKKHSEHWNWEKLMSAAFQQPAH